MDIISSSQNPKIKWIRALQSSSRSRRQESCFVVEGVRLAEEAENADWPIQLALFSKEISERGEQVINKLRDKGMDVIEVSEHVLKAASDTETPQGVLVVVKLKSIPIPEKPDFIFIPDNLRDPGNLGTILRSAVAAGVNGVLLPPGTVDPYSPKVVRAGMGAQFRLPIHNLSWAQIETQIQDMHVYLAVPNQGLSYTQADFRPPLALIIGGEAEGASSQAQRLATHNVYIPMPGGGESLNASVAAAVLFFEIVRQRTLPSKGN